VQPGDLVVGDGDGVVVIPPGIATELLADATEQEREEEFIASRVAAGERIEGLYPLGEQWRPVYQAWLSERTS
jgi:5-oxopent-3-ene-1,2,5-tricarboxylate decarboxylase / 2-hydroxyhepta-2,4-diene-1,7-dioate isomerase